MQTHPRNRSFDGKKTARSQGILRLVSLDETAAETPPIDWLWHGFLARGIVTLLTSQWKLGKTTLLSILLARLQRGGMLAERSVRPAQACVISEEGPLTWRHRSDRVGLDGTTKFCFRPFRNKPPLDEWRMFLRQLCARVRKGLIDVVVFDTLASVLPPGSESHADALLAALKPLEQLTDAGAALLLLHHPRKGTLIEGQAARGSGALGAYCDILLEMYPVESADRGDRRRRLCGWSRYDDTPRELVIELSVDGRDYHIAADVTPTEKECRRGVETIRRVLEEAAHQLSRAGILMKWPGPERKLPDPATLWRWLDWGVAQGRLTQAGGGLKGDPFRYGLPGVELPWEPVFADVIDIQRLTAIMSEDGVSPDQLTNLDAPFFRGKQG